MDPKVIAAVRAAFPSTGATGTGKTKTLQLMAEQLSGAGVPVFLA